MARWLVMGVAVAVLAGCYTRRRIIVPPTEHGVFCMKDAQLAWQLCRIEQRGYAYCDQRLDNELLRCEGAYEEKLVTGPSDGGAPEETYGLPGVYR